MVSAEKKREVPVRVFVAGHRGMVGSALVRALEAAGDCEIVTRRRSELDLLRQAAVEDFFAAERIDQKGKPGSDHVSLTVMTTDWGHAGDRPRFSNGDDHGLRHVTCNL
jgi:nucleoside-diphosphate-sugar epimerase